MDVVAKAVKTLTTPNDTTKIKQPDPITLQPNNVKETKEETLKPEKDKLGVSSSSPVISSPCSSSSEHRSSIGRCHSSPAIRSTSVKKSSSLAQKSSAHRNSFPAPGKSSRMSPVAAKSFASPKLSRSYSSAPLTSPSTPTMHEHRHPTRPEPATTNRDNSSDSFKSRSRHNSGTSSGSNSTMSSKSPRHHTQEVTSHQSTVGRSIQTRPPSTTGPQQ
uniref:Uncharacterized protein n=1 Tax=Ciona savignyi TaxID=51511 RepID=H2YQJ7_CIOSA